MEEEKGGEELREGEEKEKRRERRYGEKCPLIFVRSALYLSNLFHKHYHGKDEISLPHQVFYCICE
jgi:hypothetical protein